MKKKIIIIAVIIIAMIALVAKRKMRIKQLKPYGEKPVPVHIVKAKKMTLELRRDYLSVVEPWETADIASRISARVMRVYHDEGDFVTNGELLICLDDKDINEEIKSTEKKINGIQITIDALKTNLEFWAKENSRYKNLVASGAISESSADNIYNRYIAAAGLYNSKNDELKSLVHTRESLIAKLSYTKITSPFDGLVTYRYVDSGNLATPGKVLMTVVYNGQLKLAFDVPQGDLRFIKKGLPVRARDKNFAEEIRELKITHLYPSLDKSKMIRIEIKLPTNDFLKIGAFVPISVVQEKHKNVVAVPSESLIETPSGDMVVFVVKNNILAARRVRKIIESGGMSEVIGVAAGEEVVTSSFLGWSTLSSGLKVEAIK